MPKKGIVSPNKLNVLAALANLPTGPDVKLLIYAIYFLIIESPKRTIRPFGASRSGALRHLSTT